MSHASDRRPSGAATPSGESAGRGQTAHERLLTELLDVNEDGAPDLLAALLGSIEDELVRAPPDRRALRMRARERTLRSQR